MLNTREASCSAEHKHDEYCKQVAATRVLRKLTRHSP